MGVSLEDRGFISYNTAVLAGRRALDEFLERLKESLSDPAVATSESATGGLESIRPGRGSSGVIYALGNRAG
jgi:hypothetical protein